LSAQKVLNELRTSFDYVIVDSSPLLAVTDAAVLAANSDGVLIMARFGETKREQLAQAVGSLEDVGAHLLGAVFTMTPTRGNAPYSYYGSYGTYGTPQPAHRESPTEPVPGSAGARHTQTESE
jgi:receptor protein-tyrosine kinase